jgi:heme oxygenase
MGRFAVNVSELDDRTLSFYGFELIDENEEFKVYTDKNLESHIVAKNLPYLFVEDMNDAATMPTSEVIAIPDDVG